LQAMIRIRPTEIACKQAPPSKPKNGYSLVWNALANFRSRQWVRGRELRTLRRAAMSEIC